MIGDEQIQASIIAKLKALTAITNSITAGATEIRELQWQGDNFTYPNIRLDLEKNEYYFDEQELCGLQDVEFSLYFFSEGRSSKECSQIKTIALTALVGLGFSNLTYLTKFSPLRLVDNVPAVREDERVWRSQIKLSSKVNAP